MERIGPELPILTRRIAETPPDFLDEPRIGNKGRLVVVALVCDLLNQFGYRPKMSDLIHFESDDVKLDRNRLQLVAVVVWVLGHDWFAKEKLSPTLILALLAKHVREISTVTHVDKFITDYERREELARTILARLKMRPKGESKEQAIDRLSALSGIERQRLLAESREAEKRARQIREALARKAAQESADKWTRE